MSSSECVVTWCSKVKHSVFTRTAKNWAQIIYKFLLHMVQPCFGSPKACIVIFPLGLTIISIMLHLFPTLTLPTPKGVPDHVAQMSRLWHHGFDVLQRPFLLQTPSKLAASNVTQHKEKGNILGVECVASRTHKSLLGTLAARNVRYGNLSFILEEYTGMPLTIGP